MKRIAWIVGLLLFALVLDLGISVLRAPVELGESKLYTEKELRSAVWVIRLDCLTDPDYRLRRIRYVGDELSLIEQEYYSNFQEEYGEFDECAVFLTDFHSPRHFGKEADDTDWEYILARKNGGRWRILLQGDE